MRAFWYLFVGHQEPVAALCLAQVGQNRSSALKPSFSDAHLNSDHQGFSQPAFHCCNKYLSSPCREKFMLILLSFVSSTLGWCLLQQPRGRENNDQELRAEEKKDHIPGQTFH